MAKRKFITTVLTLSVCFMITLFLLYEDEASNAARKALALAASYVIPTLFPYMVISSVIISFDLFEPVYRHIPSDKIFFLPRSSASVILTGLLCGFPVGASGTCKLYENGKISKDDASRLCAVSSNTSPAFIIGTVGGMWGKKYAVFLLAIQTLSAMVIGICLRGKRGNTSLKVTENPHKHSANDIASVLCRAVSESSFSCLSVCGYIVFFRVTAVILSKVIPQLTDIFSVIFEFSSGCAIGASRGGIYGICLTGFAVGFSGLSVFMQTLNLIGRHPIPFSAVFVTKLAQGAILSASSAVFYLLFSPDSASASFSEMIEFADISPLCMIFMLLAVSLVFNMAARGKYFTRKY